MILYVSLPSKINATFVRLQRLLQELGLTVSAKKLVTPSTQVTCLGIVVDIMALSVSIPADKLHVVKNTCLQWSCNHYWVYYCTLLSALSIPCISWIEWLCHYQKIVITTEYVLLNTLDGLMPFYLYLYGVLFFNSPPPPLPPVSLCIWMLVLQA